VRVFGSRGTITRFQENPNYIVVSKLGEPTLTLSRGRDAIYAHAQSYSRIPSGHPEGYFEAFANIYMTFITALAKKISGQSLSEGDLDFPQADAGAQGVKFINKCADSSPKGAVWVDY
jgi:hypothetical protein